MYEVTELQELEDIYCEMHKDVYGVKARWYRAESVEQARKDLDALQAAGKAVWAEEERQQAADVHDFEMFVLKHCGGDLEKAVRWQHDALDSRGDEEHLEYCLGLPFGYFKKQRALRAV